MSETKHKKGMRPGRAPKHGAYSLMVKAGDLPKRRTYLRAYLAEVREALIKDLGPREEDLTAGQRVLVNGVISKLSVTRCIEEYIRENGVFVKGELNPVLAHSYLAYTNSLRLDLQALGINTRKREEILDLGRYIAAKDAEAQAPGPEAEGVETGPHSETSSDSPGHQAIVDDDKHKGAGDGKE